MKGLLRVVPVAGIALLGMAFADGPKATKAFAFKGDYVEGCSCAPPCTCLITDLEMGCQGVGFFNAKAGSTFDGNSFAGVKFAYATKPGSWVMIYIDAPSKASHDAAKAFATAFLTAFGKVEEVKDAKIEMTNSGNGNYSCSVDNGKVMKLHSEIIKGGDGKGPMTYSNIHDPVTPTVMQGKTISGHYHEGKHEFELKGTNAYYNPSINSSGRL